MSAHKEIARAAYELFEKSGRVHGRDLDHWLEAEARWRTLHNPERGAAHGEKIKEVKSGRKNPAKKSVGRSAAKTAEAKSRSKAGRGLRIEQ